MKNTKKILFLVLIGIAFILMIAFLLFEFYVWKKHDFSNDYNKKQKCIEVLPLKDLEQKECDEYR